MELKETEENIKLTKLASCGTCVRHTAENPNLDAMDEDVEGVYEKISNEEYTLLMEKE